MIGTINGGSVSFTLTTGDNIYVDGTTAQIGNDTGSGVAGDSVTFNDLTANNSQLQVLDPNSTSFLDYTDYSGLNDSGKLEDQTYDYTNNTSQTTWYDPTGYSDVEQATEKFTGIDDSGNLSSLGFNTTNGDTYSDSFSYSGSTLEDVWQEVTKTSNGQELSDDEFNSAGQLVDEAYGYSSGYVPSLGYAYTDAVKAGASKNSQSITGDQFGLRHVMGRSVFGSSHQVGHLAEAGAQVASTAETSAASQSGIAGLVHAMAAFGPAAAHVTTALPPPYMLEQHNPLAASHV